MGLSRLAEKCRKCPFAETCNNKQMEALGYLPDPIMAPTAETSVADLAQPILRETMTIMVNGFPTTVYKDEIEKELYKHLYSGLGLQFGG